MTSVWIRTINGNYKDVEKISGVGSDNNSQYNKRKYTLNVRIGGSGSASIYDVQNEEVSDNLAKGNVPDFTIRIKHIIRWIDKAKILASEKNEPIFLDFNKDFDNPIVED